MLVRLDTLPPFAADIPRGFGHRKKKLSVWMVKQTGQNLLVLTVAEIPFNRYFEICKKKIGTRENSRW
ncbi:MAG: hypothetical protein Kow0090_19080 [Myxococcota bacterium]